MCSREWGGGNQLEVSCIRGQGAARGHNGPMEKSFAKYALGFKKRQPKVNSTSTP